VVDDDITTMTLPGAYTLEKGAAEDGVSLTVGKAGDVKTSVATVDLTGYITDVTIE
jgi:riboflavin synthase alpha subunit